MVPGRLRQPVLELAVKNKASQRINPRFR